MMALAPAATPTPTRGGPKTADGASREARWVHGKHGGGPKAGQAALAVAAEGCIGWR